MASVSTSHLILFIASMIVAAGVSGVLIDSVERVSGAVDGQSHQVSESIRTDVEIISDPDAGNIYENDQTTLLVKNVGSRRLSTRPGQLDVVVNGTYRADVTITVVDGETWDAGNVARVEINGSLAPDTDHRVLLIAGGDEEVFQFRT